MKIDRSQTWLQISLLLPMDPQFPSYTYISKLSRNDLIRAMEIPAYSEHGICAILFS